MPKNLILTLIVFLMFFENSNAQFDFSHEIGAIMGPTSLRSDFGERYDTETNFKNTGYSVGLVYYLNFTEFRNFQWYSRRYYFSDHFRVRSELSYTKVNLSHFGKWVDPSRTSATANQLRAMHGSSAITNIGSQLEFYPLGISDFTNSLYGFSPYASLGFQVNLYKPEIYSDLGPINTPISTPVKYMNAISNKKGTTMSIVTNIGCRFKCFENSDFLAEIRWQGYFSDWVDGMKPDPNTYTENKSNDWAVWFNVGYVYYLPTN